MNATKTEVLKNVVRFWFRGANRNDARAFAKWARSLGVAAKAHYNFVDVPKGA